MKISNEPDGSLRILQLEDNPNDHELVVMTLRSAGLDCEILCVSSRAAYEHALQNERFDLILSDFSLPDFNGLMALSLAQKNCPLVPFLFVSATIGEAQVIEAMKCGATDFVLKDQLPRLGPAVQRALSMAKQCADRLRAEAALRESQALRTAWLDAALDCIIGMDSQGRIIEFNPAAERTFGYSRGEAIGACLADLIIPLRMREQHRRGLAHYLSTGEGPVLGKRVELKAMRKDGAEFPVELAVTRVEGVEPPVFTGFLRDISDRKRAELRFATQHAATQVLAESATFEETIHKLLQTICEGLDWDVGELWMVDAQANVLRCASIWHPPSTEFKDFAELSLQLTFAPGVGLPGRVWVSGQPGWIADLATDPDSPRVPLAEIAGPHGAIAFPILQGGKTLGVFKFLSREVRVPDEDLLRMFSVFQHQVALFIERTHLEDRLRRSQKMQAVGQLASGVAHDFNNLLTVIQGNSELLLLKGNLEKECHEELIQIQLAVERAGALTRQLLLFGRKQAMRMKLVNLNRVVQDMTKMLRRLIGEDIALELQQPARLPLVKADAAMIEQVLMNLSINARDAMPHGGQLLIRLEAIPFNEMSRHVRPEAEAGEYVCLTVRDTGCGMSPEVKAHLFEPFFTTKAVGKGTGLGLATVYGIVRQHQGWIEVNSEVGHGTTVQVYWPASNQATGQNPALSIPPGTRGGAETILLVEDDTGVQQIARLILEKMGYRVLCAGTGALALNVWQKHDSEIALVITDMVMPDGMTGRQLGQRLEMLKPGLKILYTSGYSTDTARSDFLLEEGVNFLAKPYRPQALAGLVRKILDN